MAAARRPAPGLALAGEAHLWGLGPELATLEEVLELGGAVFLGALALEAADREEGRGDI